MLQVQADNPTPPSLEDWAADEQFIVRVPIDFARRHGVLGLSGGNGRLPVAVAQPQDANVLDLVARFLDRPVRAVPVDRAQLEAAVEAAYGASGASQGVGRVLDQCTRDDVLEQLREMEGREDLLDSSGRAPLIQLVNLVLHEAIRQQASDVHVQPYEDRVVVRLRVDGVLADAFELPRSVQEEMVSRIKVMAAMDIAEKRLPQDGRATVQVGQRPVDLRIATLPTSFGERVVIRLLDKSARLYRLSELGMPPAVVTRFRQIIGVEHGLILVTGPTGSGKTTTLYATLAELNHLEKNVLTLEDPIEYQLPGISQTQVNTRQQFTFASGLRHVLRQDPDIIMVGEVRDHETASMAIQSALTGHLVFSTLHTNDAASAVTRLMDLGIEPYLVASSLVGVLAQRLVRRVCPRCSQPYQLTPDDWLHLNVSQEASIITARRGVGCDHCRGTGYRGRLGLFELLCADTTLRQRIHDRAPASELKTRAVRAGMKTLSHDGLDKVIAGLTTADEVIRVTSRATE